MHRRTLNRSTAKMGLAQPYASPAQSRQTLDGHAESGHGHEDFLSLVVFVDRALIGLRKLNRSTDDCVQHGIEIERGIDRAQYLLQSL